MPLIKQLWLLVCVSVCVCELANNDCGYFHKVMASNNVVNYASTDFLRSSLEIAQVLLNCRRGSSCSLASCRLFAEPRPNIYMCVCVLSTKQEEEQEEAAAAEESAKATLE